MLNSLQKIVQDMKADKVFQEAWLEVSDNSEDIVQEVKAYNIYLVGYTKGMKTATKIFKNGD